MKKNPTPPVAPQRPKKLSIHGHERIDPFFWMNERDHPDVLAYLAAENAYYDQMTAHTKSLEQELYQEMRARIKEDDQSVPYFKNGYWYITRYQLGQQYPLYVRQKELGVSPEELLFDVNEMAQGHTYYQLGHFSVSPDNRYVVFSVDRVSRRQYTLQVKDLETGVVLDFEVANTPGNACWSQDSRYLFYAIKDPVSLRCAQVWRCDLFQAIARKQQGADPQEAHEMVYEELDETFDVFVSKSRSGAFITIGTSSTLTSEYHWLSADQPLGAFTCFSARETGVEYDISHFKDHFYITTNKDDAENFKVMRTALSQTDSIYWEPFIEHHPDRLIEDFTLFNSHHVLTYREGGLTQMRITSWLDESSYLLPFEGETYTASMGYHPEFDTQEIRYHFSSLTRPSTVYSFDLGDKTQKILKTQEVYGGFDPAHYASERVWATSADGTQVPISLVYRQQGAKPGPKPLLLYGYGAYGHTIEPYFSSVRLSLLDRGFVYAIAHVRGGEYLGRPWYESGKMEFKQNTFTDFIHCAKHLINTGWTEADKLCAYGGSAGGLLIGAVINQAPELFKAAVANVPFVDVVTTMLDDTIPLTTGEYDEWGNPNHADDYYRMLAYSPYDQVKTQDYPNLLVLTGYHDSQVQYWEPAKWVAKLRLHNSHERLVLFQTNMQAGHSGASGRFEALKEIAQEYAFMIDLCGNKDL